MNENSTGKYEFILDKSEISEFCRVAMIEQLKRKKKMWFRFALLLILEMLIMPEAALLFVIIVATLIWGVTVMSVANIKKTITGQKWTIWLEDGMVKANRDVGGEMPCSQIELIRMTPHLLMFGYMQTAEQPAWYMIPLRAFETPQEQEMFLDKLRRPQAAKNTYLIDDKVVNADKKADDVTSQQYIHFTYEINEEKWVHFHKGASGIITSNTIGKTGRIRTIILFTFFMMVFLMLTVYLVTGHFRWWLAVYSASIAVLLSLRLFFRNPEKGFRKQMKSPVSRNRVCGNWRAVLQDEGIETDMPIGMKNYYPWESLEWLVESGDAFYLFHKDKKHYILIPKESFQDWNQVSALHQLCAQKGIKAVQAKKAHYIPDWMFVLLFVLFIVACIGVWAASLFWNLYKNMDLAKTGQEWVSYGETEFNPADYPDYEPLERQVEILGAFGFDVPDGIVESARSVMTDYNMPEQIVGYPYTWLLSQLGAPDRDEDWRISSYQEDVFWFDFEGWDISTDYIDILNGMLALAKGSSLDSVCDIKEDTTKVDWEAGNGTVTVSLTWEGENFSWDMDVTYDWIDSEVLGIFNALLSQEKSQERFYVTGDNGQGAIVFFCTADWAQDFMNMTGLELVQYTAQGDVWKNQVR